MNSEYIGKAMSYHGQPLQKIWDDERGGEELRQLGLTQMNFSVYLERQKYFTFQERAKRLKVHQFLTRKAVELYDRGLVANVMEDSVVAIGAECLVQQPPYEFFTQLKDKRKAWTYRLDALKQGSIIYASVMSLPRFNRLMVKPLCSDEPLHLYLADIPIKATIMQANWGPLPLDKQGNPRQFGLNDILRCEVCQISSDAERLALNMIGIYHQSPDLKLGLCDIKDLPKYYRQIHSQEHPSSVHYEDMLSDAPEFENPNYDLLFQVNGLQPNENFSMMSHIKLGFPEAEYASELRQKQASQWAFRSVADGIEHFKNGQQVEAFQCLNKALNIDPRNVEGLVARGALYANRGSFLKGLQDFEKALNLNKYHVNARIYMCETLVALGRSYEEKNCIPDAVKAYNDCLNLLPQHAEARLSLDALQRCSNLPQGIAVGVGTGVADGKHTTDVVDLAQTSDESSSSSGGSVESESEDQTGRARGNSTSSSAHPTQFGGGAGDDKLAIIDAEKANEFKLDEDETMSSVRRLLREANKHKKAKKKGKKKKDKKEKKTKSRSGNNSIAGDEDNDDLDPIELLKKFDIKEAFRLLNNSGNDAELKARLREYLQKGGGHNASPPPPPPSMARKLEPFGGGKRTSYDDMGPSTSRHAHAAAASTSTSSAAAAVGSNSVQVAQQVAAKFQEQKKHQQQPQQVQPTPRFSFQIKRPLQMDKFGLLRLAMPEPQKNLGRSSSSRSRSRSRSRSNRRRSERRRSSSRRRSRRDSRSRSHSTARHTRTRSRSRRRRSMSRSRSRSRSPRRYGGRFGRGRRFDRDRRSRSRSVHRRRTPSPFVPRRTPSPFVPRRTPSPASRFRRSRSRSRSRSYSPRHFQSRYTSRGRGRGRGRSQNRYAWFNNDQRTESNGRSVSPGDPKKNADGSKKNANDPTIEEVDEMIKNAQKERKQGLIEATSKDVRE